MYEPMIDALTQQMRVQFECNKHRGGWKHPDPILAQEHAFAMAEAALHDLHKAVTGEIPQDSDQKVEIRERAAALANCALIIAQNANALEIRKDPNA